MVTTKSRGQEIKRAVGQSVPRHDAYEQVTGQVQYTEDIKLPGMLHTSFLRAKYPHARIVKIDTSRAEAAPGVRGVITARDVPHNFLGQRQDQPVLTGDKVRYLGDPVAAVAAETAEQAYDALAMIDVEYEELAAVFDPEEALKPGAPILHGTTNLLQRQLARRGDVDKGFAEADLVIEETFRTQFVEHAPIEPQVGLATPAAEGGVVVYSGSSRPFYIQSEVSRALKLPMHRVRVIGTPQGGGFGGKNEPNVEPAVALLAMKTGRPVRAVFSREEEFVASTVRHPFTMTYRSGVTKAGRILARQIKFICDSGAYAGLGPVTVIKAAMLSSGPYRIDNIQIEGLAAYTNHPVASAMRGFGVPQVCFAWESHTETIARRLGMDSLEFRMLNAFDEGDITLNGDTLFSVGVKETIRQAAAAFGWTKEVR